MRLCEAVDSTSPFIAVLRSRLSFRFYYYWLLSDSCRLLKYVINLNLLVVGPVCKNCSNALITKYRFIKLKKIKYLLKGYPIIDAINFRVYTIIDVTALSNMQLIYFNPSGILLITRAIIIT
jgi:hypothetical protein